MSEEQEERIYQQQKQEEVIKEVKEQLLQKIKEKGVPIHRMKVIVGYFLFLKDLEKIFDNEDK
jgi:hypothetical protein